MIPGRRAVLALVAAGLLCALAAQGREARLFATPSEVERFRTEEAVKTAWNWLLDNRDAALDYRYDPSGSLLALRPGAADGRYTAENKVSGRHWTLTLSGDTFSIQ